MSAAIPTGSFLVYHFRTRDYVRCDRAGEYLTGTNEAGLLFDSLEKARSFAISAANVDPAVGTGIFDSAWKVLEEHAHPEFREKQAKANAPPRLLFGAALLLLAGAILLWLEVHSGWTLIIGVLVGARLLVAGVVRLATGFNAVHQRRKAARRPRPLRGANRSEEPAA